MSNYLNEARPDIPVRSDDPEVIRRDIEATRADLSRTVDALTDKVSPSRVVGRRVDRAKSGMTSMKDRVMGSSSHGDDHGAVGAMSGKAASLASSVGDTASSAPMAARQQTQGNPLAAGLIAFGVGWLASSLLPATEGERRAAATVKDKAGEHSATLTAPLKEAAAEARDNLRAPAQQAVGSVKAAATDAVGTVRDEASAAKDDVTDSARDAKGSVQHRAGS